MAGLWGRKYGKNCPRWGRFPLSTPKPDRLLVTPHHDPALVRQFSMHPADCTLWEARFALPVPVLVTIPGCGHDPVPYTPAQFAW